MLAYILVFTCTWWIVFFMILPFAVTRDVNPELGNDKGAPVNPRLGIKILATTIVTLLLTKWFVYLIDGGYLSQLADKYINFLSGKR